MASLTDMLTQREYVGRSTARRRSSGSQGSTGLDLSAIIDDEKVREQQDGIVQRADRHLGYANEGAPGYTMDDLERLRTITEGGPSGIKGWAMGAAAGLGRLGKFLDRGGTAARFLLHDALYAFDTDPEPESVWDWLTGQGGLQFTLDDYWDALAGNYEELARDNPGVGLDDEYFSMKDVADLGIAIGDERYTWKEGSAGASNKWIRSPILLIAEAIWDPVNLVTGGLSGMGKRAAVEVAEVALQRSGLDVLEAMSKFGDEVLTMAPDVFRIGERKATDLELRMFREIQSRSVAIAAREAKKVKPKVLGDILKEGAGWTDELTFISKAGTDTVKVADVIGKGRPVPKDAGLLRGTELVTAAERAAGNLDTVKVSWFGELNVEIGRTISNKLFHSQNKIWRDWVDHAQKMGKIDPMSQLTTTTGGLTFGVPFGRRLTRQKKIPFLTELTRGQVSQFTRRLKPFLGGTSLDNLTFELATKFNNKAYGMRLARISNEVIEGTPTALSAARFAQYAEVNASMNLFNSIKPYIGAADLMEATKLDLLKQIRKALKKEGIARRSGGRQIEEALIREIGDAWGGSRRVNVDALNLNFTVSDEIVATMDDMVAKALAVRAPTERFVSAFIPDLAAAIKQNRPYTPLRMTEPGVALLRELAGSITGDHRSPSLNALVEEMRVINRLAGEGAEYMDGLEAVRRSLQTKAHATGILDETDQLTIEDVMAFFSTLQEVVPTEILMGKQLGDAAPFKMRKVGSNGMWVFNEEAGVMGQLVFENPEMMNRKFSAMMYALTQDAAVGNRKMKKYRKLANERLFDTDLANSINYWHDSVMEATLERVRGGLMLRTGLMESGIYLFEVNAFTRNAVASGVADQNVKMLENLTRALMALRGELETFPNYTDDQIFAMLDDIKLPNIDPVTKQLDNGVDITLDVDMLNEAAVAAYVDDLAETARVVADTASIAPEQWQAKINAYMADGLSRADAEARVVERDLTGFKEQMYGLVQSVEAHIHRKYSEIADVSAEAGDVVTARVVANAQHDELMAAEKEIVRFYNAFVDSIAGSKVAPKTRMLEGDDLDKLISSATQILTEGGTKFRERQIALLETQIMAMEEGISQSLLKAEIEMYKEVDRLVAAAKSGTVVGDLTIDFISGGANGVDMMTLIYVDKLRAQRAAIEAALLDGKAVKPVGDLKPGMVEPVPTPSLPAQHSIGSTGGTTNKGLRTSEAAELTGISIDDLEVLEQQRLGIVELLDDYNGKPAGRHPARTMKNVDDGDATIVYFPGVGGTKRGYISGGSADTVFYALRGSWPVDVNGTKQTFSQYILQRDFTMVAEGVWVPKDTVTTHRPVLVVGYVAREHVRPDLTGLQHSAIQQWLHSVATDGKLKLNMAGPRQETYNRHLGRVDEVGNVMFDMDAPEAVAKVRAAVDNGTFDEFSQWVLSDPVVRAKYTKVIADAIVEAGPEVDAEAAQLIRQAAVAAALIDVSKPLNIPALLTPAHPEYMRMRFGKLVDSEGRVIAKATMTPGPNGTMVEGPVRQTVVEFVDRFNTYLGWLADTPTYRFQGGNFITVEDVLRFNVDAVQLGKVRYRRNLERIMKMAEKDGGIEAAVTELEKQGVSRDTMESMLHIAELTGEDPQEALARLSVHVIKQTEGTIVDEGRLKGVMTGSPTVRAGGSIGVGEDAMTASPVLKTLAVNEKGKRIVRELAEKYGIETGVEGIDEVPIETIWDELRLFKTNNPKVMSEEIPAPLELTETPGFLSIHPNDWVTDRSGGVLGINGGEDIVTPAVVYSAKEQAMLRSIAGEMHVPGWETMSPDQLAAYLRSEGWLPDSFFTVERKRWVDAAGEEMETWQEAFVSRYDVGVAVELRKRQGMPVRDGGDRVDVFRTGVPAAELVFADLTKIIREAGSIDTESMLVRLWGMDLDKLKRLNEIIAKTKSEVTKSRDDSLATILAAERNGQYSRSVASRQRKAVMDIYKDEMAYATGLDLNRSMNDIMQVYLESIGFLPDEVDSVVQSILARFGSVGYAEDIPTSGRVAVNRGGVEAAGSYDDATDVAAALARSGDTTMHIDRAELFQILGHNPETTSAYSGRILFDGLEADEAQRLYTQAIIEPDSVFFEADATIRLPPVDRLKGRKYYSTDYVAGKYDSMTRRELRDATETGRTYTGRRPVYEEEVLGPDGVPMPRKQLRGPDGELVFESYEAATTPYGSKRQVVVPAEEVEIDPFSRDLNVIDETVPGGLGPQQVGGGEPQTQAINFGPDIPRDQLGQREVLTAGEGFVEKLDTAVSPPAGQKRTGAGLQKGVERLMDMIVAPAPGETVDTLLYQHAVKVFATVYDSQMMTAINLFSRSNDFRALASTMNVSASRAFDAWRLFKTTGDPEALFDTDLIRLLALHRLTTNGGTAAKNPKALTEQVIQLKALEKELSAWTVADGLISTAGLDQKVVRNVSQWVVSNQKTTVAQISKEFGLSRKKANLVLDILQANGIVGPKVKGKQRRVLADASTTIHSATGDIPLTEAQRHQLMEMFPDMGSVPEVLTRTKVNQSIYTLQQKIIEGEAAIAAAKKAVASAPVPKREPTGVVPVVRGDIFENLAGRDAVIVTTNGMTRRDGTGIMGAGIADQFKKRVPGMEAALGAHLRANGNVVGIIGEIDGVKIVAFPVKPAEGANKLPGRKISKLASGLYPGWGVMAEPELIDRSSRQLLALASEQGWTDVLMPPPGTGNGQLEWGTVEPLLERLNGVVTVMNKATGPRASGATGAQRVADAVRTIGATKFTRARKQPSGTVGVGRGTAFGNPFVVKSTGSKMLGKTHPFLRGPDGAKILFQEVATTADAVLQYKAALWYTMKNDAKFARRVATLRGRTLWYPGPAFGPNDMTHADPLARAAEYLFTEEGAKLLKGAPPITSTTPPTSSVGGGLPTLKRGKNFAEMAAEQAGEPPPATVTPITEAPSLQSRPRVEMADMVDEYRALDAEYLREGGVYQDVAELADRLVRLRRQTQTDKAWTPDGIGFTYAPIDPDVTTIRSSTSLTAFPGERATLTPEQLALLAEVPEFIQRKAPGTEFDIYIMPVSSYVLDERPWIKTDSGMFVDAMERAVVEPGEFTVAYVPKGGEAPSIRNKPNDAFWYPFGIQLQYSGIELAPTRSSKSIQQTVTDLGRRYLKKIKDMGRANEMRETMSANDVDWNFADTAEMRRSAPVPDAPKRTLGPNKFGLPEDIEMVPDAPIVREPVKPTLKKGTNFQEMAAAQKGDVEVRQILDDAPDAVSDVTQPTTPSPSTIDENVSTRTTATERVEPLPDLDIATEEAMLAKRRTSLAFLEQLKQEHARRSTITTESHTDEIIEAIHPGGVPLSEMPTTTRRLVITGEGGHKYRQAITAIEAGAVWVGNPLALNDVAALRKLRGTGQAYMDVSNSWIIGKLSNPFKPRGVKVTRAYNHPLFNVVDPLTGSAVPVGYQQVPSEMVATGKYHDLLWTWIRQSPDNATIVRNLHGRTLVDVQAKRSTTQTHVDVLRQAADWLYFEMKGIPPNNYTAASPLTTVQKMVTAEADEVVTVMRTLMSRIGQVSDQAANVVSDVESLKALKDKSGAALTSLLSMNVTGDDVVKQARRLEIMNVVARTVYGVDAKVTIHSSFTPAVSGDIGSGVTSRYFRIRMPGDDVAAVVDQVDDSLEAFGVLVKKYMDGETTVDDLAGQGLDMVVQAGDMQKKINQITSKLEPPTEVVDAMPMKRRIKLEESRAQADVTLNDFRTMLNHMWNAIRTGDPTKLRTFIGVTEELGVDATAEWTRITNMLNANVLSSDETDLIEFWIEAAISSGWDWQGQRNWMRAWQDMRIPHDGPVSTPKARKSARAAGEQAAVSDAVAKDDAVAIKTGQPDKVGATTQSHRDSMRFLDSVIANLEQVIGFMRHSDTADIFDTPKMDGVRLDPRRRPGKAVQGVDGSAYVYTPGKAGNHQSYAEALMSVYSDLERLTNDSNLQSLHDLVYDIGEGKMGTVFSDADMRGLIELREKFVHFYDTSQPWWTLNPRSEGFRATDTFGLSGSLNAYFIDPLVGAEMNAADRRLIAMASNRGTHMVLATAQKMQDWWKRAATLPKLTFHIRNMIGGLWNNMMIGVGPIRHLQIMPDVYRFLKAKNHALLTGWNPKEGFGDAFEDLVLSQVSEKNRAMFRAAAREMVFDSSFSSTFSNVIPKRGMLSKVNPASRSFYGYSLGGAAMEHVEGVLRMAAFSKYFDETYPILSGRLATTMVNLVHFDYSATTAVEDRFKTFVPFWVWTRNNVPLQFRMLMQQPRYINMYEKTRRYWNETVEPEDNDDPYWEYYKNEGWVMPWLRRENEAGWAQMIIRPDLPMTDLLELPLFTGRSAVSIGGVETPLSNDFKNLPLWGKWASNMLGPFGQAAVTVLEEQNEASKPGYAGDIAPVGLNFIADTFNLGKRTPQGDRQLPKYVSELAMTMVPFWYEYADMAGASANSPYRLANQGVLPGEEDVSAPWKGALVSASRIGTGFGFRWFTDKDVFFIDREVEEWLDELYRNRRIQMSEP